MSQPTCTPTEYERLCRNFIAARDAYFAACDRKVCDDELATHLSAVRLVRAQLRQQFPGFTDREALILVGRA